MDSGNPEKSRTICDGGKLGVEGGLSREEHSNLLSRAKEPVLQTYIILF